MLLEEDLADEACRDEDGPVVVRQRVGADELDDVEDAPLAGQEGQQVGPQVGPGRVDPSGIPARQRASHEGVGALPGDRWEVTGMGQLGVERPEGAGEAEARLRHRLAEIAAGRGDGADERHGAFALG